MKNLDTNTVNQILDYLDQTIAWTMEDPESKEEDIHGARRLASLRNYLFDIVYDPYFGVKDDEDETEL